MLRASFAQCVSVNASDGGFLLDHGLGLELEEGGVDEAAGVSI